jgi:hypothetical protein
LFHVSVKQTLFFTVGGGSNVLCFVSCDSGGAMVVVVWFPVIWCLLFGSCFLVCSLFLMVVIWFLLPGLFPISYVGHRFVVVMRGVVVALDLRWGGGGVGDGFGLVGGSCIGFVSNTKLAGVGVWLLLEEGLMLISVFVLAAGFLVLDGVVHGFKLGGGFRRRRVVLWILIGRSLLL